MMAAIPIEILDSCQSTNDYIKQNYASGKLPLPRMITARQQRAGRGRGTKRWVSTSGLSLTSSLGIRMQNRKALRYISLAAGEAVVEVLYKVSGERCILKWPNDIYLSGRKLAGILVDTVVTGDDIVVIIGIGINLNHSAEDFPKDLKDTAISLYMATGRRYETDFLNTRLAEVVQTRIVALEKGKFRRILRRVRKLTGPLINKRIRFRDHRQKTVEGIFKGLDRRGGARIYRQDSGIQIFYSGEMLTNPPGGI